MKSQDMSIKSSNPSNESLKDNRWGVLAVVMVAGVVADQFTKKWADRFIKPRGIIEIIEGYFQLRYSRNPGAFFSLGADLPPFFRRAFFVTSTIVAIGLMANLYKQTSKRQKALMWALVLLLTGAVGNLIDRVLYGEVIDFLHLHIYDVFHWATFNVADMCISAGLVLLVIDMFTHGRHPKSATS